MSLKEHHIEAVLPLTFTAYASDGQVIFRKLGLRPGSKITPPRHLQKKIARTETMDKRGVIVDRWQAQWPVDPMEAPGGAS